MEKLLDAARTGDLQKVRELLNQGADISAKDEDGQTPLDSADGDPDIRAILENAARN